MMQAEAPCNLFCTLDIRNPASVLYQEDLFPVALHGLGHLYGPCRCRTPSAMASDIIVAWGSVRFR